MAKGGTGEKVAIVRSRRFVPVAAAALAGAGAVTMLALGFPGGAQKVTAEAPPSLTYGIIDRAAQRRIDYVRLDDRLATLAAQPGMQGMAVAVVEDGEISFLKGYGVTRAGSADPVTTRTVFRWASLSKGVAATMVALLADEKRLSLDDPVSRWSTSLRLPGGGEQRLTLSALLSHRAGLVRNAYDGKLEGGVDPVTLRMSYAKITPDCAPGACFAYQNIAFDAASEVVEKATGERYAAAVERRLFRPLGMFSASVTRAGLIGAASWARPHRGARELPVLESYYRVPAAGGVNSSIIDAALWLRAQMGAAPGVLPPRVIERTHAPLIRTLARRSRMGDADRALDDPHYGLGWRIYDYAGHRLVGHRGAVSGYRSLILFDPAKRHGVVALWNSESARPVGLQLEVLDMALGLPHHDWLKLDDKGPAAPLTIASAEDDDHSATATRAAR